MQNHSLSGENAEIAFRFLNDQLVSVVLMMPLTDVSKVKKIFYVLKTQFDLVLIENGKERLDIIEVSANTFAKDEFTKLIAEFENNAYQKNNIKYTFISKNEFKEQSRKARNFSEIFKDASMHMRAATYSVGRKDGQVIGTISFIAPGVTKAYLDQNPIVEDF
jgi:benzoyl-CoA reductase/2-hydroxyglutaryl-CoA dehydratase subunit BcrC/BadD/HgdB